MKKLVLIFLSISLIMLGSTSKEECLENMNYYESKVYEAGSNDELGEALNEYDNFLNKDIDATYKYLLSKLNKNIPLKNAFIASQSEWIKLRDKEFNFIKLAFEQRGGSYSGFSTRMNMQNVLESRLGYLINLIPEEGDISGVEEFY